MKIEIKECNNIEDANVEIVEGALNIKYGVNGTGKTTISKAIVSCVNYDEEMKKELVPYKNIGRDEIVYPIITGIETIKSVSVFNESYVNNYIFLPDELIKDSFNIFVKSKDYDLHFNEIKKILKNITGTFNTHNEFNELLLLFSSFIDGFGKSNSGYSKAGALSKGIGSGNKLENISSTLKPYEPYIKDENNIKWLKWQSEGKNYIDITSSCPYCLSPLYEKKDLILELNNEYSAKGLEQIIKTIDIFDSLLQYFDHDTQENVKKIISNINGFNDEQIQYLIEIKNQAISLLNQLTKLKTIGYYSLKDSGKVVSELKDYEINLDLYSHFNSELLNEKVSIINSTLNEVIEKAGILQGEIEQQKKFIKDTIEMYKKEIDEFLHYAGYTYEVDVIESNINNEYKLVLKPARIDNVNVSSNNLSYGERNAFALVLFMYGTLKQNPDLIILDDPISSFDGNKKYAIINMLFNGRHSFKNRTVLMLTHEFNTVLDIIYNLPYTFSPKPNATFLNNNKGILTEKTILKSNIQSFIEISKNNISSSIDNLNKLIYLRRLFEFLDNKNIEWQLVSNIFHKRKEPEYKVAGNVRKMTEEEIQNATNSIRKDYINDFNYDKEFEKTQDISLMKSIYFNSKSNYEKLQIYRIIFNDNNHNDVIKKYVNETFHIENDYLFQLNPCDYEIVPQYVIDICNQDIDQI